MKTSDLPTVVLFGSAARGDNDPASDVDILVMEQQAIPKSIKKGKIEIQILSKDDAIQKAMCGDLFMLHVVHEGVVISDPTQFFPKLREQLVIKKSYDGERKEALLLAGFIYTNWYYFKNVHLMSKRIAWSVRTIIISKLVEGGRIIFSPKGLCEAFPDLEISSLIQLRRSVGEANKILPILKEFIILNDGGKFIGMESWQYGEAFKDTGRSVALSTFRGMLSSPNDFIY